MKKPLSIIAGIIAGVISFCLLITIFADNQEEECVNDWDPAIQESIYNEYNYNNDFEFEIIYLDPIEDTDNLIDRDLENSTPKQIAETENADIKIENTYKIKSGDNLWDICIKFYGEGNYCYALAEYNDLSTDSHIITGHKLIIPNIYDEEFVALIEKYNSGINNDHIEPTVERVEPAVSITIPTGNDMRNYTEEVDTSNYKYIGDWKITGYDPTCAHCCGGNTHGIGAAGVEVIPGYSVATKDLPLNITLYIEGYGYYVNEDRGCGEGVIDIVCTSHEACYPITNMYGVAVYIVE